jgi:hypothetical protein
MTAESERDDHDDFLDDDFVIEDIAPKNDDLDRLFESPAAGERTVGKPADADAEDVLFATPEAGAASGETFQGGPQFAEAGAAQWDGGMLDLDGEGADSAAPPEVLAAAEASFTKELGSLLQGEEDFALDSEQELEVIREGASSDGVSEFEQSGPFVLDDGDGIWQDEAAAAADADAEVAGPLAAAASAEAEAEAIEPGWEPLPSVSVDGLAEVEDVARADGEAAADDAADPVYGDEAAADDEAELVGAGVAAEVDGHDLYAEEPVANEVLGARPRAGGAWRVAWSLAALLTVLAAAAVMVMRPEWVGLRLEPAQVELAQVPRPEVAVPVPMPPAPEVPAVEPAAPAVAVEPPPVVEPTPVAVEPPPAQPVPVEPTPVAVEPKEPVPGVPAEPVAVVPAPPTELPGWPAVPAVPAAPLGADGLPQRPAALVRVSDDLMIGDPDESAGARGAAGVMPGSRAFAQLQNGNFFIGNVKSADAQRITLRVDNGEVTIPVAAIARLTELGSADYEDLQKVTSGFVRLTNNNRLVGGILSGIADDHVVLEFRKNRVMLPKALVGQVVQGEGDAGIRLDTTREEDDWLRRLVERQLGTGTGAEPPATPPQGARLPR